MISIAIQPEFRPALPVVFASKDYREFRSTLEEMDRILKVSEIEHRFIEGCIDRMETPLSAQRKQRHYKTLMRALRYTILLGLTGDSYRKLSCRVADSQLFQWFTHSAQIDGVRPASKSAIERFEKMFSSHDIATLIHDLNKAVCDQEGAQRLLYRETELRFDEIFADTTCVQADIHFPVDWVLLRDATRTLIKAIMLIRAQGLKHRIDEPKHFLSSMNKLCIEMTHTRKKKNGKKIRKKIFRRMKTLIKTIIQHAENYHSLLDERWSETEWSEFEARVVIERIKAILEQMPKAIHQAHERIIGERRVVNEDKLLSLYEPDIHVLVRGKAGAEVEFGNALYLAEQADGLIVDWKFIKEQPSGDSKLVNESIQRISTEYNKPNSYTADRGFDSSVNRDDLEGMDILNAICPRSVVKLQKELEGETFCRLQKRRGSTEARIGIFKNAYLGNPLRSKGFTNRKIRIEWCILIHNLWKLARMAAQQREENAKETAKAA